MAELEDNARLLAEVNRELEQYGRLTNDTAEKLKYAQTGISNFEQKMKFAGSVVGGAADAFVSYNKAIYKTGDAATAASAAIGSLTSATKEAAIALSGIVKSPALKLLILGAAKLAEVMGDAAQETIEHTKQVYKTFQDLSEVGNSTSKGMQGTFDGLQKLGLGLEDAAKYIKVIEENADVLAKFGGSVAKGSAALEDTVKGLRGARETLALYGLDKTKIVEETARYIRVQSTLTRQTKEQMDTSEAAVMKYVRETDILTRLTGAKRKEQEDIIAKAQSEEIFGSFTDEMRDQGKAAAAKNLETMNIMITQAFGADTAQQFRDSMVAPASDAAKKFTMAFGGVGQDVIQKLQESGRKLSPVELGAMMDKLAKEGNAVNKAFRPLRTIGGDVEKFLGSNKELRNAQRIEAQGYEKIAEAAEKEQERLEAGAKDAAAMARAQNAAQDAQLLLQQKLNLGMQAAIETISVLADKNYKDALKGLEEAFNLAKLAVNGFSESMGFGTRKDEKYAGTSGAVAMGEASRISAQEARNILENGSERDIKAFGGREYLQGIVGKKSPQDDVNMMGDVGGGAANGGSGIKKWTRNMLSALGLKIKEGDVQKEDGDLSPNLVDLMQKIQSGIGGFTRFTSANDNYHKEGSGSKHPTGMAADFTISEKPTVQQGQEIVRRLKEMGASYALDEYNNPSSKSTAGHFHVEIPKFEYGGTLGAGKMGIAGEAGAELITGPASITPMNDLMRELGSLNQVSSAMLSALKEIARKSGEAVDTSKKMLQVAQN